MRDFRDAKAMAQTLREALQKKSVDLTHSESLELTARMLGCRNWNVLAARIEAAGEGAPEAAPPPSQADAGLPVVPVRDLVLFPEMTAPLFIGRPKSIRAIERAMAGDRRVLLVSQKRSGDDDPGADDLHPVGVVGQILDVMTLPEGQLKVMVRAAARARIRRLDQGEALMALVDGAAASAQSLHDAQLAVLARTKAPDAQAEALVKEALDRFQAHANVDLKTPPQAMLMLSHVRHPGLLADMLVNHLSLTQDQRQALLETEDPAERLRMLMAMMPDGQRAA
jgi:ATP-dependent Lon protease